MRIGVIKEWKMINHITKQGLVLCREERALRTNPCFNNRSRRTKDNLSLFRRNGNTAISPEKQFVKKINNRSGCFSSTIWQILWYVFSLFRCHNSNIKAEIF